MGLLKRKAHTDIPHVIALGLIVHHRYCVLLFFCLLVVVFLQIEGKTLHQQKDDDSHYWEILFIMVVWNWTYSIFEVFLYHVIALSRTSRKMLNNIRNNRCPCPVSWLHENVSSILWINMFAFHFGVLSQSILAAITKYHRLEGL